MTNKIPRLITLGKRESLYFFALSTFVKFINDLTVFKLLQEKYFHEKNKPGRNAGQRQVLSEGEVPTLPGPPTPGGAASFNRLATRPPASQCWKALGTTHRRALGEETTPPAFTGLCPLPCPPLSLSPPSPSCPNTVLCSNASQQNRQLHKNCTPGNGLFHFFTQNLKLQPCQQNRNCFNVHRCGAHRSHPSFLSDGDPAQADGAAGGGGVSKF